MKPIADMDEVEFAHFFHAAREKILTDPLKYFVKAKGFINFTPTPGQTIILKSAFGQALDPNTKHKVWVETATEGVPFDLEWGEYTEPELYQLFTGGMEYEPSEKKFNRINLLLGRRSGKTTVASVLALYSTIKVNWKPFLSKTPVATVAVLSHSVEFSQEIIDILKGMVDESPVLSRLKDPDRKNTHSTFHLKVPFLKEDGSIEYSRVAIKVGAASKKTTRGRAVCTLLADECCYWALNDDAAESDAEIFKAVRPALMQFGAHGTIIKMSSPATKAGVMYTEWQRRDELKDEYIQLKAPSWMINTTLPKEEYQKEFRLDPDGFETEFRSNFRDSMSSFILPEFVDLCTMTGVTFNTPSEDRHTVYSGSIDAAFKGDRFAFSLVGFNEKRVTQYVLKYWEGSKKKPVQIHEVASFIRTICRQYGLSEVIGDQFSFQPLRELFLQYGINLVENTFTLPYKRKIYFGLKRLINNQQIDLLDIPLQAKELKELVVEQTPTGQIRIGHPQGGSDDCADALAVAAYRALEKAGTVLTETGEIAMGNDYGVQTDAQGRAFTAPPVELLQNFPGFEDAIDNSREWAKDPVTGKLRRISELEDEDGTASSDTGNFVF